MDLYYLARQYPSLELAEHDFYAAQRASQEPNEETQLMMSLEVGEKSAFIFCFSVNPETIEWCQEQLWNGNPVLPLAESIQELVRIYRDHYMPFPMNLFEFTLKNELMVDSGVNLN